MLELLNRDIEVPAHAVEGLKAGRSLAAVDEAGAHAALEIVEMNLLALAGAQADAWQRRVVAAYAAAGAPASAPRMVTGLPKDAYWVRVATGELPAQVPLGRLDQEDGFTLLHGKREDVMAYLRQMKEIRRKGKGDT